MGPRVAPGPRYTHGAVPGMTPGSGPGSAAIGSTICRKRRGLVVVS
ncbi:hypothetical protein MRX96_053009, partial [Rhipicephalus microplus]